MTPFSLTFDPDNNILRLNDEPVSLHCHFFNCGLLKALEEIPYIDGLSILREEAAKQFYVNFKKLIERAGQESSPESLLKDAAELYRFMGFGRLDLSKLTRTGGTAWADSSYYVVGWLAKYGKRTSSVCHLTCGFISGIMAAIFDTPLGHYEVEETECMILGSDMCRFTVLEKQNGS
ncbi:V4R domain-containing protein [Desulfovulcanus sp.]